MDSAVVEIEVQSIEINAVLKFRQEEYFGRTSKSFAQAVANTAFAITSRSIRSVASVL
jgi:hypothetical protein